MTQIAILVPILATLAVMVVILPNGIENLKRQTVRVRVRKEPGLPPKRIPVNLEHN